MAEPGSPAEVLIVGGGVAALETVMALRDLAGGRDARRAGAGFRLSGDGRRRAVRAG